MLQEGERKGTVWAFTVQKGECQDQCDKKKIAKSLKKLPKTISLEK